MIAGIEKESPNYLQAIMKLTNTMRNLYVHALQSYIWNKTASARIKKGVDKVCNIISDWRLHSIRRK